jgi:4'-phosphopantetheinyl transferase
VIAIAPDWREDPRAGAPRDDEVRVWAFALDGPWPRPDLERRLADEERRRAAAFHFERDRRRFVVARATLRAILASALGTSPSAVAFAYGPRGKPSLARAAAGEPGLRFNLSHSSELALAAVARGRELGVDLERVRPELDCLRIARRFFTAGEQAALEAVQGPERLAAFFRCWTCKEAYLKAIGQGLFRCSTSFDVALAPGAAPRLASVHGEPDEAARWSLHDLAPADGYVGAVLVQGHGFRLTRWRLVP